MKDGGKFVVQRHTSSGSPAHWDLMFEAGAALETYRVDASPQEWSNQPAKAVRIFDHSLKFLTYEGPVNQGRGSVQIADSGTYKVVAENADERVVELDGKVVAGRFLITFVEDNQWKLARANDDLPKI